MRREHESFVYREKDSTPGRVTVIIYVYTCSRYGGVGVLCTQGVRFTLLHEGEER